MAALIPNIALAKWAYYCGLPAANDQLYWIIWTGGGTDATLRDLDDVAAIEADAGFAEAGFTGYGRVAAVSPVVTVDDGDDDVAVDMNDPSWNPTTAEAITRITLAYDPDITGGTDADLVPLFHDDFATTTATSGSLTYQVATGGPMSASE